VTGKLAYTVGTNGSDPTGAHGPYQLFTLANAGVTAYPTGFCGDSNTKQLNPGESCIIQVRFAPLNTVAPGAIGGQLNVQDANASALPAIPLKGTSTSQILLSGSAITLDTNGNQTLAFGNVGKGLTATQTFTVTNAGGANAAGGVTLHVTNPLPARYSFATNSACVEGTVLAGSTTCQMSLVYTGIQPTNPPTVDPASIVISNATPALSTNVVEASLALTATSVAPATIALYGFGDYPANTTSNANAIELGAAPLTGSTGVLTLWFINNGGVAATNLQTSWTSVLPTGNTDFTVAAEAQGTCFSIGGTLAPGATCSVNVRCSPTGNAGERFATLNLFGQATLGATVILHATGITTSNSVYANNVGGTSSFYTFAGSTAPAGATAYFVLQNNTTNPLDLGTNADFTNGTAPNKTASNVALSTATSTDFALIKATNGTGLACGTSLGVGAFCTFAVTFAPTWDATAGAARLYRWAEITVAGNPNILGLIGRVQMPATLKLSATSTASVTVSSLQANFGQLLSGQTPSLPFTITNIGDVPTAGAVGLTLISSTPTGTYAALGTSTCGTTALAAGANCTVTVNSQLDSVIGPQSGLSVRATDASAAGESSAQTYTLVAQVVNLASLSMSSSATAFAATPAGTKAAVPITITVTNGGTGDDATNRQNTGALAVTLSDPTNFALDPSSTCLNAAGTYVSLPWTNASSVVSESCTLVVNFIPQGAGSDTTTVTVTATPGAAPTPITLTGTGQTTLAITPVGPTTPQQFTVTHSGSGTTQVLRESLSGTNAAAFAITADTCFGTTLTGTGHCTVTVVFLGTCSATTAQTATLNVTDGGANSTTSVALSVGGTAGCGT
jgi:hypothetical protein